jgi:hypothetical protein
MAEDTEPIDGTMRPEAADYRAALRATTEPPPGAAAAVRLAAAIRALAAAATASSAPDDLLLEVAGEVERLNRSLLPHAALSRYDQAARLSGPGTFINHPMIGPANGCAPPISVRPSGAGLVGELEFRSPQEGPPGYAYGGYIAAGFDAVLLMTAGINGLAGPTRALSVTYRAPTPLNAPVRYAAVVEAEEERDAVVRGQLMAGDVVCAEGTARIARARLRG